MPATVQISLRPATDDDIEPMCALQLRSNEHDRIPQVPTVEEMHEEIDGERVRFDTDVRIAEVAGAMVGFAHTLHMPSDVGQERCYVFGTVDPAHRGRGIGRALLAWGIERGSAQLRSSGSPLPKYLRVDGYEHLLDRHRLFARLGFHAVRWFEELRRPLDSLPEPTSVPGLTMLPWDSGRDEEIRLAKNNAFMDHWGSTPSTAHDWQQMVHGTGGRPDLSFFVVDDDTGRVVAHCLNQHHESDEALTGRREGWIHNLGTVRDWRGRGVASMLVGASLHAFARAGFTDACIGVDSENPSGAARLYRGLGFELDQRAVTHEIRVDG